MTEKEENTDSVYQAYQEWGGIVSLSIELRLPKTYLDAVRAYCKLDDTPVRYWINNELLNLIESIEVGAATPNFVQRFHLKGLRRDRKDALMHAHTSYALREEKLGDS